MSAKPFFGKSYLFGIFIVKWADIVTRTSGRPARACAARRTNRPFVPCTLDLVTGIKELFKVGAPIRHRSFMSTRPSCVTQIASPGNRRGSPSLMLLLVAQQSSLLVPYLEAVPIGDVMVRAQCLGGFKR
jgi:hypothetical protein